MKRLIPLIVLLTVAVGCSGDAPEASVPVLPPISGSAVAAATPSLTPTKEQVGTKVAAMPELVVEEQKPSAPVTDSQTLDIEELFAPPKAAPVVVQTPDRPQPQPVLPELPKKEVVTPPNMRLIGFSELEELKALVSIDGQLKVLALGESAEGVELVELEPPSVTLMFGEFEKKITLNEQEWVHVANPVGDSNGIGPNMPLPNKPAPVMLPGGKRFPPAPTAVRTPKYPTLPSSPSNAKGGLEHRFPAASPPPVPPTPK